MRELRYLNDVSSLVLDKDKCIGCGLCSQVCPVEVPDAFNTGLTRRKAVYLPVPHNIPNTYTIDPNACTHCGACEPACPVEAIFEEDAVPDKWKDFIPKNYDYFKK